MNVNEIGNCLQHIYDEIRFNSIQSYKRGWFARAKTKPMNDNVVLFSKINDFIFFDDAFKNDYDHCFFHYTASDNHYGMYLCMRHRRLMFDVEIYVNLNQHEIFIYADHEYLGYEKEQLLLKSEITFIIDAIEQWLLSRKKHRLSLLLHGLSIDKSVESFLKNDHYI